MCSFTKIVVYSIRKKNAPIESRQTSVNSKVPLNTKGLTAGLRVEGLSRIHPVVWIHEQIFTSTNRTELASFRL